jgi:cell division protein FtsN
LTKDYKHRRRRGKKPSGSTTPFATGLALGLAVALLVHLYHRGQAQAPIDKPPPAKRSAVTVPEVASDPDPVYDFYDILPEFEVVIPGEIRPSPSARTGGGERAGGAFYLQAGSFRSFEDADRRKASLALLGIVSEIRRVEVNDRITHRVLIGPVSEPVKLQDLQRRLVENGIEYLALQAKEPGT